MAEPQEEPELPPPSYDEVARLPRDLPSLSSSDPLLGRRERTDTGSYSAGGRQYSTGRSSQTYVPDSPHSSDDEETAMLKSELRRLREEKMGQDNESKKMLLRQVLEQERRAAGVTGPGAAGVTGSSSAGTYNTWNWQQAPPVPGYNYPGAVVHPMTSNVPGQAPSGPAASQPYAAPLHCPTATDQVPSTSTATPYSPEISEEREGGAKCCQQCCVFMTVLIITGFVLGIIYYVIKASFQDTGDYY